MCTAFGSLESEFVPTFISDHMTTTNAPTSGASVSASRTTPIIRPRPSEALSRQITRRTVRIDGVPRSSSTDSPCRISTCRAGGAIPSESMLGMKKPTVAAPSLRLSIENLYIPFASRDRLVSRPGDDHGRTLHRLVVQTVVHLPGERRMSLGRRGAARHRHGASRRRRVGRRLADAMDHLGAQRCGDSGEGEEREGGESAHADGNG